MKRLYGVLGWFGMIVVLVAYFLVSNGKVSPHSVAFQFVNFLGAIALIINAWSKQAWAFLALNTVWACIALFALYGILSSR